MNDLISVIIPAFNVEKYISNCLESVLHQTFGNLEVILIDDGSNDNTGKIADEYVNRWNGKLNVIHTENQGVTAARFMGLKDAKGEWIGFVDADDEIEPDMYERLYYNAIRFQTDISHCGHRTIVNNGERIHDFYNSGRLIKQSKLDALKDLLTGNFEPSICNKIYKKELFHGIIENDVIDFSIRYNEDLLMNYYLFKASDSSVFEDFCGYHYLARSESATRNGFKIETKLDPLRVRKQILLDVDPSLKDIAMRRYLVTCANAYAGLNDRQGCKDVTKRLKNELIIHKKNWSLLSKTERAKLNLMMLSTSLYNRLYKIYESWFQNKIYE